MNIFVTGGLGGVGRPVAQRLLEGGHTVRVFDRVSENPISGAECVAGDLTDFGAVREQMRGMQAVIHLGALTNPAAGPAHDIFHINMTGAFNVYSAAAHEGVRRVVCASSINALGFNYGVHSFPIQYLPMDEGHPSHTSDAYSLSKQMLEELGRYFWRRDGISGAQLRLPFVYNAQPRFGEFAGKFMNEARAAAEEFVRRPPAEQRALAARAIAKRDQERATRLTETPWAQRQKTEPDPANPLDPAAAIAFGYTDFWSAIGVADAAQAFERAVFADYSDSHPLFVTEAVNTTGVPSEMLAQAFFPDIPRTRPLIGDESLVSLDRARALLGYAPTGSMWDWVRG